jgi:hypothetical protein
MKALRDHRSHQPFYQDEHLFAGLRHQLAITGTAGYLLGLRRCATVGS